MKKSFFIFCLFCLFVTGCITFNSGSSIDKDKTKNIVDTLSDKYIQDPHYISKIVKAEDFEMAIVEAINIYKETEEKEINRSFEEWLKLNPEITDLNLAKKAYEAGLKSKKEDSK